MANLVNIYAETGADIIGDDAQPTLTISNTSTGPALRVFGMALTSGASVDRLFGNPIVTGPATAGNATVAALRIAPASTASVAVLSLLNTSFVSAVSIVFAASANWAGMGVMRVVRTDGTFAWIPLLPDAVVTAAVVA